MLAGLLVKFLTSDANESGKFSPVMLVRRPSKRSTSSQSILFGFNGGISSSSRFQDSKSGQSSTVKKLVKSFELN